MSLVDPSPFLEKVDKSLYKALTRKDVMTKESDDAVVYIEPQIPQHRPTQPSPKTSACMDVEPSSKNEWILSSKIQTLGDFIDTDAVSICS